MKTAAISAITGFFVSGASILAFNAGEPQSPSLTAPLMIVSVVLGMCFIYQLSRRHTLETGEDISGRNLNLFVAGVVIAVLAYLGIASVIN